MTRGLVAAIVACCLWTTACAADWPKFMGPTANGFAPDTGINKDWKAQAPRELWRIALTDDGYAGPSVADGKLFIIDHEKTDQGFGVNDILRAINVADGQELWRLPFPNTNRPNYGFSRSTPVYDNGKLYVLGQMGQLGCVNVADGKPVWGTNILTDYKGRNPSWNMAMSPFIDGENVIVTPGGPNAGVVALKKKDGALVWKGGDSEACSYATPVLATIDGKRQYVVFASKCLMGVSTVDGAVLWKYPWVTGCDVNAALPIVTGNAVFITSGYGHGCTMLDIANGTATKRWENKSIQSHFSSPILSGGFIYGTTDPGALVCLNPQDGSEKWRQRGFEKGGMCAVDGTFIVCDGRTGDVVMVKINPDNYEELGRFKPLGGQSWTAPIVANGKLYVRNKSTLVCLDLMPPK